MIKALARAKYNGDALLVVLSTHGNSIEGRGVVSGWDTKNPVFVDDLIETLAKCHEAIPKLVLISACRGENPIKCVDVPLIGSAGDSSGSNIAAYTPPSGEFSKLSLDQSLRGSNAVSNHPEVDESREMDASEESRNFNQQGITSSASAEHKSGTPELSFYDRSSSGSGAASQVETSNICFPTSLCPKDFLIMFSCPKGCVSGRLPTKNLDPSLDEGSIFLQIFLLHIEQCLKDSQRGICLLPLLTGVQNEITLHRHECAEIVHSLTKIPVLWKNSK